MINPVKTAVKCCGCIVLTQLIGILVSLGLLAAFILTFYFYAIPWGEDQIRHTLQLPADTDIGSLNASIIAANNCSGCVFGVNTDWPTNTTGALHFLDTSAGPTASAVIATSLVAGAAAGVGSMLWASFFPSAASVMSFSSGFYEMTHIIEQAQFIGMISQLQIDGAPVFLHQFSREMAWTNFNVPKPITDVLQESRRRRRLDTSLLSTTASGETGPKRYAALIGVEPKNLFFYTLLSFAFVIGGIHALFFLGVILFAAMSKKTFGQVAGELYRKVIWACILALLLAQYIFSMAGSYYIYENGSSEKRDAYFVWGTIGLIVMVGFAIVFGVMIVGSNRDELEDLGTYEHDQRPFAAKYSAYYDEYNFDNRFFFVPRILLAVTTGAVVGTIQDSTTQLLCILGITILYLVLLLWREPNLLRFLYYIGITSVFMKVVLVCMMLMLVQDNFFPQEVRDNVAYGIIGVNMFIFFLLFLRQAYTIIHKLVRGCKNKDKSRRSSSVDEVINLEHGNEAPRNPPYARMESSSPFDNPNNNYHKGGDQRGFNNQNAMAGQQQQQQAGFGAVNQQGNHFARDNFGGAQRSPYERPPSDVGMVGVAGVGNGRNIQDPRGGSPDWGRYDSRAMPAQQQYQNAAVAGAGGVAVGATLAAAAARDRNNNAKNGQNDYYKNTGANPGYDRASPPLYGAKAGGQGNRFSAAGANPSPYQVGANANQFGKPLRKVSFDLDDMDDEDVVAEPPMIKQVSSVPNAQQSGGGDRNPPPPNRQSYLRFTDSDMSFIDDDIDGRSPRSLNAAASAGGAERTEIEDDDTALIVSTMGVATGLSTFGQRDSLDSYTTENSNGPRANYSILTGVSDTSAAGTSSNYDTNTSMDAAGFSFGDDDADADNADDADADNADDANDVKNDDSDSSDASGSDSIGGKKGKAEDGDIDIDELEPLSSPRDSLDSYDTQGEHSFRSLETMDSKTSNSTTDLDNAASVYLRGVSEGEAQDGNDIGDDDEDDDGLAGQGSNHRPESDSFFSAISTRSDDDASFYIDGQRRNAGSPPGESGGVEGEQALRSNRTMKL
ncbi:hypothetical protein PybrP1_006702 [[Pythium] brassicae (nom. inval.)]|nr:hypothetical protein PybrP1_006702 [[Pythium] brassicae (nom. inval.)]